MSVCNRITPKLNCPPSFRAEFERHNPIGKMGSKRQGSRTPLALGQATPAGSNGYVAIKVLGSGITAATSETPNRPAVWRPGSGVSEVAKMMSKQRNRDQGQECGRWLGYGGARGVDCGVEHRIVCGKGEGAVLEGVVT